MTHLRPAEPHWPLVSDRLTHSPGGVRDNLDASVRGASTHLESRAHSDGRRLALAASSCTSDAAAATRREDVKRRGSDARSSVRRLGRCAGMPRIVAFGRLKAAATLPTWDEWRFSGSAAILGGITVCWAWLAVTASACITRSLRPPGKPLAVVSSCSRRARSLLAAAWAHGIGDGHRRGRENGRASNRVLRCAFPPSPRESRVSGTARLISTCSRRG